MHLLSSFIKSFADFLFPRNQKVLHLESFTPSQLLEILPGARFDGGADTLALFDYSDSLVKEIIWEVKYNGNKILADKLGAILFDIIESELMERNVFAVPAGRQDKHDNIVLIPMPISDKRRFERGWNQAELITDAIKRQDRGGRYKYLPRQLAKFRHTESQTRTANRRERLENLKDSMKVVNPLSVEGKFVVLVDDVITTGATFNEAKRALRESGAKKILCAALSH